MKACIDCGETIKPPDKVCQCNKCEANQCSECHDDGGLCADCRQAAMDNASFSGPSLPPSHETVGY